MRSKKGKKHITEITSLALSSDNKFLAAGGIDSSIFIYDANDGKLLETFTGHRDVVTVLLFSYLFASLLFSVIVLTHYIRVLPIVQSKFGIVIACLL